MPLHPKLALETFPLDSWGNVETERVVEARFGYCNGASQQAGILYDGTVVDERDYSAIGGDADSIRERLAEAWEEGLDRAAAIRIGAAALAGPDRSIPADDLEVAALSRTNGRRCFRRVPLDDLVTALS